MENRFTAWKFCHLLHKILREGHDSSIRHSQSHKKMIFEVGKLWGHLQDGVGPCIQAYSKLIVTKLDFHDKNAYFSGSLLIEFREIGKFAGEDINIYFQLCVEIFDYLDDIIDVQSKVFASVNTYRMSSMTPQGQCRLAPLITLIQDSNPLYDLSVRIMFKLHDELPNDILIGHRDRFRDIFNKLKFFYDNVRPLQYFADLIQVPHLPETAPNFTSKIDFGSYIPPIVVVPQEPEPIVCDLVNMDNTMEQMGIDYSHQMLAYENLLKEKDETIKHLQIELTELRDHFNSMQYSLQQELHKLREEISILNTDLAKSRDQGMTMRVLKDELELKLQGTPTLLQKVSEEEVKAKASEEKFNKLKHMYTQIRDEHIQLLRQHGEARKHMNRVKNENSDLTSETESLKIQLNKSNETYKYEEELFKKKSSDLEMRLNEKSSEHAQLIINYEQLQQKYEHLQSNQSEEILKLSSQNMQLLAESKEFAECKTRLNSLEISLERCNQKELQNKSEHENSTYQIKQLLDLKANEVIEMKQKYDNAIEIKTAELRKKQNDLDQIQNQEKDKDVLIQRITQEKMLLENELQDLLQHNSAYESKLIKASKDIDICSSKLTDNEIKHNNIICSLMQAVIKTVEYSCLKKFNENELKTFQNILQLSEDLRTSLNELDIVYKMHFADKSVVEGLTKKVILVGNFYSTLKQNCISLYNITSNVDKGQEIISKCNILCDPFTNLFEALTQLYPIDKVEMQISDIQKNLDLLKKLVEDFLRATNTSIDLEDLVGNELSEMDKAIEEATQRIAQMLSSARNVDTGIKLQVNEKILDACTSLMECIKILIQKSKILQGEIVSLGRGSASIKEFYKRNSQWSEGLISASKSVAKGANLLVEAADKAVSGESNRSFEIIVAAQEIAACTAQLVVASKVKAPRESQKLVELTKASRNVSHATGAIVATVKDCNQQLELPQEIDLSKLTANQAKTMEMDIHVKVLELEQALQVERLRLSAFRRQNYQNTED